MNRNTCSALVIVLILTTLAFSGCGTYSAKAVGGGTIVGNPEIPFQTRNPKNEELAEAAYKLHTMLLLNKVMFSAKLEFPWLDKPYGTSSIQEKPYSPIIGNEAPFNMRYNQLRIQHTNGNE